ncbi:MAG TPA: hypothetical protein VM166_05720 [Gemmatimonadaceae bacterium]|nr:hypothetical protein [Gemmatimonadaceae bacterium]
MLRRTLLLLVVVQTACSDAGGPPTDRPPANVKLLLLETFDGSGQAVHPDAALTPVTWGDAVTQLFVTPYPYGDASKENPSLYSRRTFLNWIVPSGVINPIVRPVSGYLSDPDHVFNPDTNELWLYYRAVTDENEIHLLRGKGPSMWSSSALVARAPNHTMVSPTVVRRASGDWRMWTVNSGPSGCASASTTVEMRTSSDGITWSPAAATDLAEQDNFPWHIDVEWIPSRSEFWATYNVKVAGSCTTAALHFARSIDGVHWTPAVGPVLVRDAIPEFKDIVYRASLLYDAAGDAVTLWYSGARYDGTRYTWRVATEIIPGAEFFARLATVPPAGTGLVSDSPPLTNADAP